jgi:hypothetical protein
MKALYNAIQMYRLTHGHDKNPKSLADLDIEASDKIAETITNGNFTISTAIGDYWGKTSVHLSIREQNNFKLHCESWASDKTGVKICQELSGLSNSSGCASEVYQGLGTFYCYELPFR